MNSGKYIVHGYIVDASGKNITGQLQRWQPLRKSVRIKEENYDVLNKVVYWCYHGGHDQGALLYFGISEKSRLAIQSRES